MSAQTYYNWDLESEKRFIDGLGTFSNTTRRITHAQLIEGYVRGLARRGDLTLSQIAQLTAYALHQRGRHDH